MSSICGVSKLRLERTMYVGEHMQAFLIEKGEKGMMVLLVNYFMHVMDTSVHSIAITKVMLIWTNQLQGSSLIISCTSKHIPVDPQWS